MSGTILVETVVVEIQEEGCTQGGPSPLPILLPTLTQGEDRGMLLWKLLHGKMMTTMKTSAGCFRWNGRRVTMQQEPECYIGPYYCKATVVERIVKQLQWLGTDRRSELLPHLRRMG